MGLLIDLVIIVVLLLSVLYGYKKGLINVAVKLCATIIAIVVTFILYVPVSNLVINATGIDEAIENSIYEKANNAIKVENSNNGKYVQDIEGKLVEDAKNNVLPQTARSLAINIVNIGVMIVLFLAVKIGLRFISSFANAISKLPIIKQFNKLGGIIYGILIGFIIILVALSIIKIIAEVNPQSLINKDIEKSNIGKFLYNNNVIEIFLK